MIPKFLSPAVPLPWTVDVSVPVASRASLRERVNRHLKLSPDWASHACFSYSLPHLHLSPLPPSSSSGPASCSHPRLLSSSSTPSHPSANMSALLSKIIQRLTTFHPYMSPPRLKHNHLSCGPQQSLLTSLLACPSSLFLAQKLEWSC